MASFVDGTLCEPALLAEISFRKKKKARGGGLCVRIG